MMRQEKQIQLILMADSLHVGGTERHILSLLTGLKKFDSIQTRLLIVNPGGPLDQEAISQADSFLPINRRTCSNIRLLPRLITELNRIQGQLIHTYGWMANVLGLTAGLTLRIPTINGSIRNVTPKIWHHRICKYCALGSSAIVANAHAGLEAYGLSNNRKARVIHNGIDLRRFENVKSSPELDNELLHICMVANFSDKKDHMTVIRSFANAHKRNQDIRLILVGRDAGMLPQNEALVGDLGLTDKVKFITNCSQPESIIAASDICVLTSPKGEGISNSLLEYMALGKPAIATDCGGNQEVIENGKTGFLIPLGSEEAMTDKLNMLLDNAPLRQQLGQSGRKRVKEAFSMENMISQYIQLYKELVPQHQRCMAES